MIIYCASHISYGADNQWSWLYRKQFVNNQMHRKFNKKQAELLFAKENVPLFSQLLFSWNALRPDDGHFSFYVQVRNAQTKKWGAWHHMADWGDQIQRSYITKSDGVARYVYVRLETGPSVLADAFRVKIAGSHNINMALIKECVVSVANYYQFKPERVDKHITQLSSVHIDGVPKISQRLIDHKDKDRVCSPTSCTMLTRFLTKQSFDPMEFASNAYDTGLEAYGSWPFNMAHAFEQADARAAFFTTRLNSFATLHQQLKRGMPTIVSVRGRLPGATSGYKHGHLLVVVGWDAKKQEVLCHDPGFYTVEQTFKAYPIKDFLRAWESSRRLVYWIDPIEA